MYEYEKKMELSEDEYDLLSRVIFSGCKTITQTNYYYDTNDYRLCSLGITCRIREKDGKYTATIKTHHTLNIECSIEEFGDVLDKWDTSLFKNYDVLYQGEMVTHRMEINCPNGTTLALDKNEYLGVTDYELEIEYAGGDDSVAQEELEYLHEIILQNDLSSKSSIIDRAQNTMKSKRFLTRKRQMKEVDTL